MWCRHRQHWLRNTNNWITIPWPAHTVAKGRRKDAAGSGSEMDADGRSEGAPTGESPSSSLLHACRSCPWLHVLVACRSCPWLHVLVACRSCPWLHVLVLVTQLTTAPAEMTEDAREEDALAAELEAGLAGTMP